MFYTLFNIYFLAAPGLHCCAWLFSSCGRGLLLVACTGFSLHWPLLETTVLATRVSVVAECGSVVVALVLSCSEAYGSSWTRDQTHVPCIDRHVLNHWATKEFRVLLLPYFLAKFISSSSRCVDALEYSM